MRNVHPFVMGVWRAYETLPTDPAPSPEGTSTQSEGSEEVTWVLSRDEWESVKQRTEGLESSVKEGFGWIQQNLTPVVPISQPPVDDVVPESQSEPTELVVQDRTVVRNKKPRLSLGHLFR